MEETDHEANLQKKEERIDFILSLIFVSLLGILILVVFLMPERGEMPSSKIIKEADKSAITIDPFRSIKISAQAVYVFDAQTGGVLYAHNEEAQLPLASIAKLMTVIVAYEEIPLQSIITITLKDLDAEGDSGLLEGERWKLEDILGFTLMVSSNDGARALATASLAMRGIAGYA